MEGKGRTALVTGASSGMGWETARRLAEKGFEVIAAARRLDRLEDLAKKADHIIPRRVDLSEPRAVDAFCGYLSGLPRPVSVLVNNAGYSVRGALEDVPMDAVMRVFQVNLFALIRITQACLPGMRKQREGIIVNLSSMAGKFAFPMSGVYAATKHAVEAISDSLRIEVRPFGIRVITIRPGFIATEFNEAANRITGDLLSRTAPDYKPLYQASGASIGKWFVNATVPGADLIAKMIVEAVVSDSPEITYSGGFLSEEFQGKRFQSDDEAFDRFLTEKTGLTGRVP
jgi:NAD(P)-dependent dehydrogenase (short-subunit alcohol dehydrogenase family)